MEEGMAVGKRGFRWVMLSFSFAIAFLLHLLLFATAPMVTTIMREMALSHAGFGTLFSAAMISLILFRIPWGMIGDRTGYVNAFKLALPISAISAILRAFSTTYMTFALSQFLLGAGLAAVLPCLPLIVKEWLPERVGLSTGIYVSGFAVGNATALALTPYLLETMVWRDILLIYGVAAAIVSGLWCLLARSAMKKASEFKLGKFLELLRDRYVWILLLFMVASMGTYDTLATWMPRVLEMKKLDKTLASLLPLGFFLSGPVMGYTLDKFQNRRAIVAMLGAAAATSILGVNYAPFPLLLPCIFLAGFMSVGVLTISLSAPLKHERLSSSAGSAIGLISSLSNIGPLTVPVFFGFLIDVTGTFQTSILTVSLLVGVTFIVGSRLTE
jgi:cyanate permease